MCHLFLKYSSTFLQSVTSDSTHDFLIIYNGKAIPVQTWTGPDCSGCRGSQISRQSVHEGGKAVSSTYRPPLPSGNIPGTHFCRRLSRPQGHSAAGRIMSMTDPNDTIGNRTRDLPVCKAAPQSAAPPRVTPERKKRQKLQIKSENYTVTRDGVPS